MKDLIQSPNFRLVGGPLPLIIAVPLPKAVEVDSSLCGIVIILGPVPACLCFGRDDEGAGVVERYGDFDCFDELWEDFGL